MLTSHIILLLTQTTLGFIEGLIGLRILLKFFGANQAAPFVRWVYETSSPLLSPFIGMFPSPFLQGGFIIEFSAVFGLLVYALIGYFIENLLVQIETNSLQRKERLEKKR